jgi:type I restriction enzyme, R subunit
VEVFILDSLFQLLPSPAFSAADKEDTARHVYRHIWQQSARGLFPFAANA